MIGFGVIIVGQATIIFFYTRRFDDISFVLKGMNEVLKDIDRNINSDKYIGNAYRNAMFSEETT